MKKKLLLNLLLALSPWKVLAALTFDVSALETNESELTEYTKGQLSQLNQQLPGAYPVEVIVNGNRIGTEVLNFVMCDKSLCPEVSVDKLIKFGLNTNFLIERDNRDYFILDYNFQQFYPGASFRISPGANEFIINIPQRFMNSEQYSQLDNVTEDGIPVGFLSYYYNGQRNTFSNKEINVQHFASFNNGLNLGAWRIRQSANLVKNNASGLSWKPTQTFVGRDILSIMSRLVFGQTVTTGRVFDSYGFKGVSVSSIDEMLPDSQRNYAPVIKGIALSQATVEVRQDGNLIYQKNIPAGSFEFNDVVPNNSSGNLEVIVHESTGEIRKFVQPYATQPKMVRKDQLRYGLNSGVYDDGTKQKSNDIFLQAEAIYGLGNVISVFSGAMVSNRYISGVTGVGINLGDLGGVSMEIDLSRTKNHVTSATQTGSASKLNYSKYLSLSGTTLQTSLTQTHDNKFLTYRDYKSLSHDYHDLANMKRKFQIGLNQNLNKFGSLSFNYFSQNSWDYRYKSKTLNANYNTNWGQVNVGVSYSHSEISSLYKYYDNVLALNLTIPFSSIWGKPAQSRINHSYITSHSGISQNQTTVSGSLLKENNLNYSISQIWAKENQGQAARIQYDGGSGSANAGLSQNNSGYNQYSLGASGSVVLHPGGLTFGQSISPREPFAIVSAPGVENVSITTKSGVSTNRHGYAIVPALTSYRSNSIGIDPTTVSEFATINSTQMNAIPGFGTAINARFNTAIGRKAWIKISHAKKPLSLGTELHGHGKANGIVDDESYAWITGLSDGEVLTANINSEQCIIKVKFDELVLKKDIFTGSLECL